MKMLTTRSWLVALILSVVVLPGCGRTPTGGYQTRQPAQVTLDYWTKVNAIFARAEQQLRSGRFQSVGVFREAARAVQSLPTLHVDPQAVDWSLRAAGWCEQFANYVEISNRPTTLLTDFLRGASGDIGVLTELAAAERQALNDYQLLRQEGIRLRAQLTSRYRVEFPTSAF